MNSDSHVIPVAERVPAYDTAHALELSLVAATEAIENLRPTTPDNKPRPVYRETDDGYLLTDIVAPDYRSKAVWDSIDRAWHSPGFALLADYLWEHGSFKKTLSPASDRTAWERFVWGDLIHSALLRTLKISATNCLVDNGSVKPWQIDESVLMDSLWEILADEDARANGMVRLRATCLFRPIELPNDEPVELSDSVRLVPCSLRDLLVFFTRFSRVFSWSELFHSGAGLSEFVKFVQMEIRQTVCPEGDLDPRVNKQMSVERVLDSFILAGMAVSDSNTPIAESRCIIEDLLGESSSKINRVGHLSSFPSQIFDEDSALELGVRFRSIISAVETNQEMADALFFFGRSATAPLQRDVLLEAVVGLDRILARGPESRYRVRLHGSVLLGKDDEEVDGVFDQLGKIYNWRSKAAHGSTSQNEALAKSARRFLVEVLMAVLRLADKKELDLASDISEQIETYVRRRAAHSQVSSGQESDLNDFDGGGS